MNKSLKGGVLLAIVVAGLGSCGEEEDQLPAIVGEWQRDFYQFTALPPDFSSYEGVTTEVLYQDEESYTIIFSSDNTYQRKIIIIGDDLEDTGRWTLEGDSLKLNSDAAAIPDESFGIEGEITSDKLSISQPFTFDLLPDAVQDTLTLEWANKHPEELATYFQSVEANVLFLFKK